MNSSDRLITFSEGAKLLGISLRQFRRVVDSGRVAVVRITERTPRVRMSDLDALVAASVNKRSAAAGV